MNNQQNEINEDYEGLTPTELTKRMARNEFLRGQKQKAEHQAKLDAQTVSKGVAKYIAPKVRDRFSGKMEYTPEELDAHTESQRIGKKL